MNNNDKKTEKLVMRLDAGTKYYLKQAANEYGVSMSSLVLANIKQMVRSGDTYYMLPERFRQEYDARRENARLFREYMRSSRSHGASRLRLR